MKVKKLRLGKYLLEFASVFIAVIAAFALDNWNDNRRDDRAEEKILREIRNGLVADIEDIRLNKEAHELGIKSCNFFRDLINDKAVEQDSLPMNYMLLTSDNTSLMNNSGYEALKSKGLEIVKNDSIRSDIISLYEGDYQKMYKFEETFPALQFFENYGAPINKMLAPYMEFDEAGNFRGIEQPVKFSKDEKNLFLSYLWRIQISKIIILREYGGTEEHIQALMERIDNELEN